MIFSTIDVLSFHFTSPHSVGGAGDGGKWVCGVENLRRRRNVGRGPSHYNALNGDAFNGADVFGASAFSAAGAPCIVYSLGSHNNFDWEVGIKAQLPFCDIFTFDCTEVNPSNRPAFVEFKPWCVGNAPARVAAAVAPTYLPLSGIMDRLGHKSVALLKMDVEGAEFDVFAEVAKLAPSSRPRQIVFELHYMNFERQFASKLIISSMLAILESGYQIVSREHNQSCPSCMETIMIYTGVGVA